MDELIGFLIPIIIIISIIVRAVRAVKKEGTTVVRRQEKWQYVARQDELRKFLQGIGVETGQAPPQTSVQPHMVTTATPREVEAAAKEPEAAGEPAGVVPTAPRRRAPRERVARGPQQQPAPASRLSEQADQRDLAAEEHPHKQISGEGEALLAPAFEGRYVVSDAAAAKQAGETGQRKARTAAAARPARASRADAVGNRIRLAGLGRAGLRQGIILSEILSPPLALRGERER